MPERKKDKRKERVVDKVIGNENEGKKERETLTVCICPSIPEWPTLCCLPHMWTKGILYVSVNMCVRARVLLSMHMCLLFAPTPSHEVIPRGLSVWNKSHSSGPLQLRILLCVCVDT